MTQFSGTKVLIAVGLVFSSVLCTFAKPKNQGDNLPKPEEQRYLTIMDSVFPYDLNPHTASYNTEAQILTGLYEGLFSYDPANLDPTYALCTGYKISRDKKRWTFTIRKDATFSNGDPITAQTFKDSWLALLSEPGAPFASLIDCISGAKAYRTGQGSAEDVRISVRGDNTLIVHLDEPTEHLPRILCHCAFTATSTKKGVYSGPFTLESYADSKLVLKKNPKYRDAFEVQLPGIIIIQSDDTKENAHMFNTGSADWITGDADVHIILNKDSLHISALFGTTFLFFKSGNSYWSKPEFRQALLEAIPYAELRKDYSVPATTLVYPLAGYPKVQGRDDYDQDDALILMKAAREGAGLSPDEKIPLVFAIPESEYMRKNAEILKKAWEPLGVDLKIEATPSNRYNASIPDWNADLFTYSWIGDFADPLAFLELFRGTSSLNIAGYQNSEYDELLLSAARAENTGDHNKILAKAEQLLLDQGEVIPIGHQISLHIIDLTLIGGWQPNALDIHPFKYLYIKHQESTVPNIAMLAKASY